MKKAYLSIDDSPSPVTGKLVDYLHDNNIPAMLYCRGDFMENDTDSIVRAIEKDIVIANHNYSHTPAGDLTVEQVIAEIEKTESMIEAAYKKAGKTRNGKYFRFPYIDKGDGDRLERRFDDIIAAATRGETIDLTAADPAAQEKKDRIQGFLKAEGYTQPFENIDHPLYQHPVIAGDADCLFTYSSCDWMMNERHKGKWKYKTLDDLKKKIDDDPWLSQDRFRTSRRA